MCVNGVTDGLSVAEVNRSRAAVHHTHTRTHTLGSVWYRGSGRRRGLGAIPGCAMRACFGRPRCVVIYHAHTRVPLDIRIFSRLSAEAHSGPLSTFLTYISNPNFLYFYVSKKTVKVNL